MATTLRTRTQRKNRNRNAIILRLRAEIAQLRAERMLLARMALPTHPRGGFFNPLVAFEAQALATRVLDEANGGREDKKGATKSGATSDVDS